MEKIQIKLAETMKSASDLKMVMPELEALREYKAKSEDAAVQEDVAKAMAARSLPADMREMLLLYRRAQPQKFAEQYPKPRPGEEHLTRTLAAAPGGAQIAPPASGQVMRFTASRVAAGRVLAPDASGGGGGADVIDVRAYPGPNSYEKLFAYLRATSPGFERLSLEAQHKQAAMLHRTETIVAA